MPSLNVPQAQFLTLPHKTVAVGGQLFLAKQIIFGIALKFLFLIQGIGGGILRLFQVVTLNV